MATNILRFANVHVLGMHDVRTMHHMMSVSTRMLMTLQERCALEIAQIIS